MRSSHLGPGAAILAIAALGALLAACGSSAEDGSTRASTVSRPSHFEGGEASVERFGSEARGQGKGAILALERGYLLALASEDFKGVCARLAKGVKASLEQVAPGARPGGCAATLSGLLSPQAPAVARDQAAGKLTAVRARGDRAFVLFHAPGAKLWVFTLQREGGEWKAGDLAPSVLVPGAEASGGAG